MAKEGPIFEAYRFRTGPVFVYDVILWARGKKGQHIPEEVRPKIQNAFRDQLTRIDRFFANYESNKDPISPKPNKVVGKGTANGGEMHKVRDGLVFKYLLKLCVQGKHGQLVPEETKPKIGKAFNELSDRLDHIFAEYEPNAPT